MRERVEDACSIGIAYNDGAGLRNGIKCAGKLKACLD